MEYVGVDHHKKFSYLTIEDERGHVLKQGRVANDLQSLRRFLGECEVERKAVLEAGRNWTVMHDWLEEEVDEVQLAHPKKVKAIAEAKIKTDKIDSKTLADLLRADLIPQAYVPGKEIREVRTVLRQKDVLGANIDYGQEPDQNIDRPLSRNQKRLQYGGIVQQARL